MEEEKEKYIAFDMGSDQHSAIVYICKLTGKPIVVDMVEVNIDED